MSIYEFIGKHPIITFFLAEMSCRLVFRIYNRTIRCINIRKHGWPPAHCDADGDFKEQEQDKTAP